MTVSLCVPVLINLFDAKLELKTVYSVLTGFVHILCIKGTKEPQTAKRSKLAGILIAVFLVIFLVIGAVCAVIYRKQLMQKWRAFKQKAPGPKRYGNLTSMVI